MLHKEKEKENKNSKLLNTNHSILNENSVNIAFLPTVHFDNIINLEHFFRTCKTSK